MTENETQTTHEALNQQVHRSPGSVWHRRGWDGTREQLTLTRWLVGVGGGALAVQGLRQGTWQGRILAGVGSSFAWWALTGEGDMLNTHAWYCALWERAPWRKDDARVTDASAASFPASDAPSWTPTIGTRARRQARR